MTRGFTLIEVIVALLVLEIGVLGVAGLLHLASTTLVSANVLESGVTRAEGILDSLRRVDPVQGGSESFGAGDVHWSVDSTGVLTLRAVTPTGDTLFVVTTRASGP